MGSIKSHNGYVVGIGEILWDKFPTYRRMGGAPANFAYHASRFGHVALVLSAIGDDPDGLGLVKELDAYRLPHYIETVGLPTGTVTVDTSIENAPRYTINTDVAWSVIPFTENLAEIARNSRAVCYGTLAQYGIVSKETISRFLDAVPEGCKKIYDINLRENAGTPLYTIETITSSIIRCNILKVNIDELNYLINALDLNVVEEADVETKSQSLLERYPNIIYMIVTMGTNGSWVLGDRVSSFHETPQVRVVDVVGAGDSFTGAFVGSMLNGQNIEECHKIAVNVSAYVCTQPGAMPQMPDTLLHNKTSYI